MDAPLPIDSAGRPPDQALRADVDVDRPVDVSAPPDTPSSDPLSNGLVGHWKLDEPSGTSAADSSGKGHTGSLHGGTSFAAGKLDNGLVVDGVLGSYVSVELATTATDNITLAAWVYWRDTSALGSLIVGNGDDGKNGYHLLLGDGNGGSGNKVTALLGGVSFDVLSSTYVLPTNTWTHLALTRDSGTWKLYVDGSLQVTGGNTTPATPTIATSIGGDTASASDPLRGIVDDVRIYDRALSASDVASLYAGP